MKPGTKVQHPDYTPFGVVVEVDGPIAVVKFASPDGWPFPRNVRIPVTRLKRYTPPQSEQDFEPAPF
jgi:hypothetical protein